MASRSSLIPKLSGDALVLPIEPGSDVVKQASKALRRQVRGLPSDYLLTQCGGDGRLGAQPQLDASLPELGIVGTNDRRTMHAAALLSFSENTSSHVLLEQARTKILSEPFSRAANPCRWNSSTQSSGKRML
jgi:hypothetical protein